MLTLGLEGTAHTTSASILDEKQIYSMVSRTYKPEASVLSLFFKVLVATEPAKTMDATADEVVLNLYNMSKLEI